MHFLDARRRRIGDIQMDVSACTHCSTVAPRQRRSSRDRGLWPRPGRAPHFSIARWSRSPAPRRPNGRARRSDARTLFVAEIVGECRNDQRVGEQGDSMNRPPFDIEPADELAARCSAHHRHYRRFRMHDRVTVRGGTTHRPCRGDDCVNARDRELLMRRESPDRRRRGRSSPCRSVSCRIVTVCRRRYAAFITNRTRRKADMSRIGSPSKAARSASRPGLIWPSAFSRCSTPRRRTSRSGGPPMAACRSLP